MPLYGWWAGQSSGLSRSDRLPQRLNRAKGTALAAPASGNAVGSARQNTAAVRWIRVRTLLGEASGMRESRLFNRDREVERRRRLIERLHSPRLAMALIAALTAAGGLLASYGLLRAGLGSMALRYPLAVGIAYLVFLGLLWCWLHWRFDGDDADVADLVPDGSSGGYDATGPHDGGGADPDWSPGDFGDGEGAIIGLVITAAIALFVALFAAFSIISAAPVLLAELLVDLALAGGLYRHVRSIDRDRHWLKTALARTFWRFAAVAAVFAAAGWFAGHLVPGADSIGDLLH